MTWEERMGARSAARREERETAEAVAWEEAQRPWVEFVQAHDGGGAVRVDGLFIHSHYFHGNAIIDAATGRMCGCFSVALSDDMPPPPDECSVCAAFKLEDWT